MPELTASGVPLVWRRGDPVPGNRDKKSLAPICSKDKGDSTGEKDCNGREILVGDKLQPVNGFIGPEGHLVYIQKSYQVRVHGINGQPNVLHPLWGIGPENYKVIT